MKSLVAVLALLAGVVVATPADATVHTVAPVPGSTVWTVASAEIGRAHV